jgi:MFS family permease
MRLADPGGHWLRRTGAALLQADRPVPQRTEAEIAAEVERNYRWNFAVNVLDGVTFFFGISFISASTIAPLFISKLTTSPLPIGLVAILAQSGWYLPQLLTANLVERLPRKKPAAVYLGLVLERLPLWLLVAAALLALRSPALALALFFAGYAWHNLGAGVVATAWQELIARCFPAERRGRFFGTATFLGSGMGAAGAALSAYLLQSFPFPASFVAIFGIGAITLALTWFFLAFTREPLQPLGAPQQSSREFLAGLPDLVRGDRNYRRFLLARSLIGLGSLGTGFVTVAAIRRWQVPDATVGIYTAAYLVSQTASNLIFGLLADRLGHKLCLEVGALASALAFAAAWLAPSPGWYYVVFCLLGVNLGSLLVSGTLVVMEFSTPVRRPTYMALANTIAGVMGIAAPLLGTGLVTFSYGWLFSIGAAVNLAGAAAMHWGVHEPRWTPKGKQKN